MSKYDPTACGETRDLHSSPSLSGLRSRLSAVRRDVHLGEHRPRAVVDEKVEAEELEDDVGAEALRAPARLRVCQGTPSSYACCVGRSSSWLAALSALAPLAVFAALVVLFKRLQCL